jgi:hypothetical protein
VVCPRYAIQATIGTVIHSPIRLMCRPPDTSPRLLPAIAKPSTVRPPSTTMPAIITRTISP